MTLDELTERARSIVSEHLDQPAEKVADAASFIDDLGADSLDYVEIIMALEEAFDIEITDDAAEDMKTFGDVVNDLAERLAVSN